MVIHYCIVTGRPCEVTGCDGNLCAMISDESPQPSPPEQGKEAIEFAEWANDNYTYAENGEWDGDNDEIFYTAELYKIFNPKWAEQADTPTPVDELKAKFAKHLGEKELNTTDAYAVEWTFITINHGK